MSTACRAGHARDALRLPKESVLMQRSWVTVSSQMGTKRTANIQEAECAPACSTKRCPLIVLLHGMHDPDTVKIRRKLFSRNWIYYPISYFEEGDFCLIFPIAADGQDYNADDRSEDFDI